MREVCLFLALSACGGSSSSAVDGHLADGHAAIDSRPADATLEDFGCGGNTACPTNEDCCAMPSSSGSATTFACVAPSSCPAPDKITCDGPDECGGTTPVCCGVDVGNGTGQAPSCGVASLGTSCTTATACKTHLASSCSDTSKVQLCHVSSECTDQANDMCCTFASGTASLTFCIDAATAQFGGGTCH